MLQELPRFRRILLPLACAVVSAAAPTRADAPVTPVLPLSVCDVVRDLPAHTGKTIAIIGRYSWREKGSWVSEDSCGGAAQGSPAAAAKLWMIEDHSAPKLPDDYELDAAGVKSKLAEMRRHTTLAKFRFGTPEYDRWAVIWGRVEARKSDDTPQAAANLQYRGPGVIFFLTQ